MAPSVRSEGIDRPDEEWAALQVRLRRLEGQARGIAEMVADERQTLEVLQQFSALIAATRAAGLAFATQRVRQRMHGELSDEAAAELLAEFEPLLERATRLT